MGKKFWDWLDITISAIIIGFLLKMLWHTLKFWNNFYMANYQLIGIDMLMFYVGILVAIVTVSAQWIEGRWKAMNRAWNNMKGGEYGKRKRNSTTS